MVFTGLYDLKQPGEYPYLTIGEHPAESGNYELHRGRPPYGKFGREISFQDLPEECRALVLEVYTGLWDL